MKSCLLLVAVVAVLLGTLVVGACGDDDSGSCPVGSEGCPCTTGGGCDGALVCASNVCVRLGADADADADGDAGACDGAWLDPTTGYLWENPPPVAQMNWDDAVTYCNGLALCGYGPGSWHLPTVSELRTLIRGCPATESGGWCGVTDSCLSDSCEWEPCVGCGYLSGPGPGGCYWDSALGGWCSWYWSSSSSAGGASYAWTVYFNYGYVGYYDETYTDSVRCVRRGP